MNEINDIGAALDSRPWPPAAVEDTAGIPAGDMPGDKVSIGEDHVMKARAIFPPLASLLETTMSGRRPAKAVVSVYGGSGVGKSEIGSLLAHYLNRCGVGAYVLSGDNYPRRIPRDNDAERVRTFRETGLKGLVSSGEYTRERHGTLLELQERNADSDPAACRDFPWLAIYQGAGRHALEAYLGTPNEIDFREINGIVEGFRSGKDSVFLKRMGREASSLWYDKVDFSAKRVLIIEWTHGNSGYLSGVDLPVYLHSTPEETLAHRRSRNRDGAVDSPFTATVLDIEQRLLAQQAAKAKLIVTKGGEIIGYERYLELVAPRGEA